MDLPGPRALPKQRELPPNGTTPQIEHVGMNRQPPAQAEQPVVEIDPSRHGRSEPALDLDVDQKFVSVRAGDLPDEVHPALGARRLVEERLDRLQPERRRVEPARELFVDEPQEVVRELPDEIFPELIVTACHTRSSSDLRAVRSSRWQERRRRTRGRSRQSNEKRSRTGSAAEASPPPRRVVPSDRW